MEENMRNRNRGGRQRAWQFLVVASTPRATAPLNRSFLAVTHAGDNSLRAAGLKLLFSFSTFEEQIFTISLKYTLRLLVKSCVVLPVSRLIYRWTDTSAPHTVQQLTSRAESFSLIEVLAVQRSAFHPGKQAV
jgi:hypothetical protein